MVVCGKTHAVLVSDSVIDIAQAECVPALRKLSCGRRVRVLEG